MEHVLYEKVINQKIGKVSMEDFMADMLEKMEKSEIENAKADICIKGYKKLNVRNKNVIDAQRVINKSLELELMRLNA